MEVVDDSTAVPAGLTVLGYDVSVSGQYVANMICMTHAYIYMYTHNCLLLPMYMYMYL